jgi:UDP-N-acetylglucosamine 2-epimerase (non-hydrolysing)
LKKILIIFGTRPEAIKLVPLIYEFKKHSKKVDIKICVTGQHREMLDQVLDFFDIIPDYDFNLMKKNQNLHTLTADIILHFKNLFNIYNPDYVFIHGDTTTAMAACLSAFYSKIKICHIEAGLRTNNINSPFPEELNRQIISRISNFHFAPTKNSEINLLKENINHKNILITGNTVIDSLLLTLKKNYYNTFKDKFKNINFKNKIILITIHRRENQSNKFIEICKNIKELSILYSEVEFVFPVHLNPNIKSVAFEYLDKIHNIKLLNPLCYQEFVWLMNKSYFIITDSGGIQEEAPSLGKPVLVIREFTERTEALKAKTIFLVNTKNKLYSMVKILLNNKSYYDKISKIKNPYGDGFASKRIVKFILNLK